jgi:hypothetical protein
MRHKLLWGLGLGALAAGLAWTAAWYGIARTIHTRIDTWVEARRAEGLAAAHAEIAVDGFPLAWRVRIAEPVLSGAGAAAWAWQGEALHASFGPFNYRNVALRFPGEHRVAAGGGALGSSWRVRAERPHGRILLHPDGRLDRLELDLGAATLTRLPDERRFQAVQVLSAVMLPRSMTPVDGGAQTLAVTLIVEALSPLDPPVASFGATLSSLKLDLLTKGPFPPGRFADALRAWRDAGGAVEVNHASLRWGPVDAEANGTLTLDAQDRPLGAFAARWRGYTETIDALQAAGQIPPWPAAGAKIALNAMARQQPNGTKQVELPITLQDGRVYVVGLPLMRLAPLRLD